MERGHMGDQDIEGEAVLRADHVCPYVNWIVLAACRRTLLFNNDEEARTPAVLTVG
jgi:hypothetical protein